MWAAWVRGWALGGWGSWLGAASRVRMQDKRQRGRASKELDASTGCINWMHQLDASTGCISSVLGFQGCVGWGVQCLSPEVSLLIFGVR